MVRYQAAQAPLPLRPPSCFSAPRSIPARSTHGSLDSRTCGSLPFGGSRPPHPRLPFSRKARRRDAAGASPPPVPCRRNNGGPGRRGRGARPRAASRCARGPRPGPAAALPRRAPSPREAPGPPGARAHLVLGRRRVSPLLSKTRPEKPPSRGACTENCISASPGLGGGSPGLGQWKGGCGAPAPARTRGRRLPPARLSVSVTCPRTPQPPPPLPPSSRRRAVGPAAVA